MKKRRILLLSTVFCVVFVIFFLSSPFFKLSGVEVVFYDKNNKPINLNNNKILNSSNNIRQLTSVVEADFGTSMFLLDKNKYFSKFELRNPYAKLLEVEAKFPNKLVFAVRERSPIFYLSNKAGGMFLLDSEFKILKIAKNQEVSNLIPVLIKTNSSIQQDYFEYFDVSYMAFSEGEFLTENNLVVTAIKDLYKILDSAGFVFNAQSLVTGLILEEESEQLNLVLLTNPNYGIKLKIENVLTSFNKKLEKLLSAFKTLELNEKIKTTYGTLIINNSCNCIWNKL